MTRPLASVDGGDVEAVLLALRAALDGSGPALLVTPAGEPGPQPVTVPQRIAVVVETSGSSGVPKRVALSTTALLTSAAATESALGGAGRWLLCLPVHYVAGLQVLVRSITAGSEPVVLPAGRFEAADLVDLAARTDPAERRYTSVVPVQLARLVDRAESEPAAASTLRGLDAILVGGQSTPRELLDRAHALGLAVRTTYGSSETAGGCVHDGRPLRSTRLRLDDGQVLIGGEMLAEGYLDAAGGIDEDRTAAAFTTVDGARWYRTGDSGVLEDGVLTVTGRLDRVVISGGEKVSLDAVETAVRELGVADAVVVRAADAEWGEVPVVVSAEPVDLAALRSGVAARLGRAAAPARVHPVAAVPLLASGKPDRRALEAAVAGAPGPGGPVPGASSELSV